jgi:hypothetical protein
MECLFCKKSFVNKSSLIRHQKNAKFCLKIQNQNKEIDFVCPSCDKHLSSKQRLESHHTTCDKHKTQLESETLLNKLKERDAQIEKLDKQVTALQDKLENIAIKAISRPTTTNKTQINNNNTFNLAPITDERFIECVSKLTLEYMLKGPEGYAQFALEHPLKDSVICTDFARRKVEYKEDGTIKTDPEMSVLSSKFFKSIKERNRELLKKYGVTIYDGDDYDFIEDETKKIADYITGVNKGSQGEKTDFHHDFVKEVCCRTVKE